METAVRVPERLLRPDEVARLLRVTRRTVYNYIARGDLRSVRAGRGTLRVTPESVRALAQGMEG